MIRAVIRWMRLVLPPGWALLGFVLLYLLMAMIRLGVFYNLSEEDIATVAKELAYPHNMFMAMAAAGYGVFRVFLFHPIYLPAYQNWLKQTPWTSGHPLPSGPVHLVPQDAIILGTLLLLAWTGPEAAWITFAAFSVAYLLMQGITFWATGPRWAAYVVLFGLGMLVHVHQIHLAAIAGAAALYGLVYLGLQQAFQQFPWETPRAWQATFALEKSAERRALRQELGWPMALLNPSFVDPALDYRDGVLLSLAGGWWTYVLPSIAPDAQHQANLGMILAIFVLAASVVFRLLIYGWHCWPPVSLLGRIWNRRWIIPGYDQVFLAPLCALTVGVGLTWGLATIGLGRESAAPLTVSAVLLVTLNMGPSFQRWRLTGTHRLSPLMSSSPEDIKL